MRECTCVTLSIWNKLKLKMMECMLRWVFHELLSIIQIVKIKIVLTFSLKACMTKLELTMIQQGTILQALFAGGFFLVSLLINRISKFSIICKYWTTNDQWLFHFYIYNDPYFLKNSFYFGWNRCVRNFMHVD